jgi:hypothetical protein
MIVCNTLDYTSPIEFCSALSNGNGDTVGRAGLGHQPSMQRALQCVTIGPCQHAPAHEGMKQCGALCEFAMFWRGSTRDRWVDMCKCTCHNVIAC